MTLFNVNGILFYECWGGDEMEKYIDIIEKYKKIDDKPSVLTVIEEILDKAGKNGAPLSEIYNTLEAVGYKY